MAPKKHKSKKSSITKEAAFYHRRQQWPWSELPPTNFTLHPHNYTNRVLNELGVGSGPAITKSWPPPSTRCDARQRPHLRHVGATAPHNPHHSRSCHFLVDDSSIADAVYELPDASQYWCYLRSDPKPQSTPPPTPPFHQPYTYTFLGLHLCLRGVSLAPNAPTSALIVNYTINRTITRNSCWYREASIRHQCTTPDPFDADKKPMEFTNLIEFQGKYYATSLQGALLVMQVIHTRLKIMAVGATCRAVPTSNSKFFKEYLSKVKGEILLVFLIHRKSLAVVDHVEVFRLDLDKLCWIKIERLRGKTLFLDERCIWVDSENFGCRDDRVYFTQGLMEKSWRVYDMKSCCILPVSQNERICN